MAEPAAALRATLDDLLPLLARGEPVELIDGELVRKDLTSAVHGTLQLKLGELLGPFHRKTGGPRGPGGWWFMSEVDVLYARTEEVFRHDLMGFTRALHPERPSTHPVTPRPDWVCEILLESNARVDTVKKQRTLHAHGVPHYWLLDPTRRTLTVLRHQAEGYLVVLSAALTEVVRAEPFEGMELDLAELFAEGE